MILWYFIGLTFTSAFVISVNRYFEHTLKWGDVAFTLLMALGGPLTVVAICMVLVAAGVCKLATMKIWKKPVFRK
jgi:hypothetical protein